MSPLQAPLLEDSQSLQDVLKRCTDGGKWVPERFAGGSLVHYQMLNFFNKHQTSWYAGNFTWFIPELSLEVKLEQKAS